MKKVNCISLSILVAAMINLIPAISSGQKKEDEKISQSIEVLKDFEKMKDQIPHEMFDQTEGIVIVPGMINAGLGVGGKRGRGLAIVKLPDGKWSTPSFVTITGGSVGLQAGVESIDLVLFFKHKSNLTTLDKGNFSIGGDLSATAGPIGRSATASTDYKLQAEIYSYSRSRGVFAGISLDGAVLAVDKKENNGFYHSDEKAEVILSRADSTIPFVAELQNTLAEME